MLKGDLTWLEFLANGQLLHMLCPQSPSTRLNSLNPFDIAAVLGYWTWELLQLKEGRFSGSGTLLRLDPLLVGKVSFNRAFLQRIRSPSRGWTLIMRGSESSAIFVAGQLLHPTNCVVLDASTEIELLCHGAGTVLAISPRAVAAECSRVPDFGNLLPLPGRAQLVSCDRGALNCVANCIEQAEAAVTLLPSLCPTAKVSPSLAQRLVQCMLRTMADATPIGGNPPRATRRRAAVERARAYIRKQLTEPIKLADLCQHAYVEQRSLEYGFREVVGLSPMAYIKVLRLMEVHRRLLIDPLGSASISQVALDSGFRHLGQFASDYKRLFLENPSTTRKRTRLRNGGGEPGGSDTSLNGSDATPPHPRSTQPQTTTSALKLPPAQHDACMCALRRLLCDSAAD